MRAGVHSRVSLVAKIFFQTTKINWCQAVIFVLNYYYRVDFRSGVSNFATVETYKHIYGYEHKHEFEQHR
jgi:hypothetical protein